MRYLKDQGRELSPLLILTHDHPDPDAVASAWGLRTLAEERFGMKARIAFGGIIGRIENQTMVRVLDIPLRPFKPRRDLKEFRGVALVDTQPAFENNRLPAGVRPALVMDHHPVSAKLDAGCSVILPGAGATSVIVAEALFRAKVEISRRLATALVYGILSETQDLGRDTQEEDIRIYKDLLARADLKALALIQNPQRPKSFFQTLGHSLDNAFLMKELIVAHLGFVETPDLVSQTADFLLTYEKTRWALCTGRFDNRFHLSIRALRPRFHAGKLLREVLQGNTRAGGHRSIAGGAVQLIPPVREADWRRIEQETTRALARRLYAGRLPKPLFPFKSA